MSVRKKIIMLFSLCFIFYGVFSFVPAAATLQSLQQGMEAPDFSLKTVSSEVKSFADVKGQKLTVLLFWSTWSSKSEKALARMQLLHEKYKGQGLSIVGINANEQNISDETLAGIRALSDKMKISFPMHVDQGLVAFHDYGVIALPTIIVLSPDRVIAYELSGYPLAGSEALVDFIVSTVEGKKAPVEEKAGYQPNKNALRFFNMGKTSLKSKRTTETAETWFKKAIEADPAFVLPHLSLGKMYVQRDDAALAQAEFREALAREPGNPIALCELGIILVNEGKGTEGTALFKTARMSEDMYAPCYYYAGYALATEGSLEDAVRMFDEAAKVNPFDYRNYVYQGKVFEERKDGKRAFEAYRKALGIILRLD